MQFEIITDSSSNLTDDMIEEFGIHILPLRFMSDGEEFQSYTEGEKSDLQRFFDMMRDGKVFTTSLPYPDKAEEKFRSLLDDGRDILYIGFSSGLSGTYEAMSNIMESLKADYPDYTFDLLIGGDNWQLFPRWYRSADILREHRVLVYPREGATIPAASTAGLVIDAELLPISSTDIRRRVREGESISTLVPKITEPLVRNLYAS